jgi:hypothetical protein
MIANHLKNVQCISTQTFWSLSADTRGGELPVDPEPCFSSSRFGCQNQESVGNDHHLFPQQHPIKSASAVENRSISDYDRAGDPQKKTAEQGLRFCGLEESKDQTHGHRHSAVHNQMHPMDSLYVVNHSRLSEWRKEEGLGWVGNSKVTLFHR